jgi:hypothetical protein
MPNETPNPSSEKSLSEVLRENAILREEVEFLSTDDPSAKRLLKLREALKEKDDQIAALRTELAATRESLEKLQVITLDLAAVVEFYAMYRGSTRGDNALSAYRASLQGG